MEESSFVAMLTSLLVLAACGGGDKDGDNSSSEKDEGSSAGTLEIGVEDGYIDYVKSIVPAFEEETGIKVKVTERDLFETLEALPLDGPLWNSS